MRQGILDAALARDLRELADTYAISITPQMVEKLVPGEVSGPIYKQFVPSVEEYNVDDQELADPIGDNAHSPVPGIVHRHADRVLFKVVGACPVYCRFCFRKEMIGPGKGSLTSDEVDAAINYIDEHPEVWEVVFTGGDPFMLSPRRIAEYVDRLDMIDHVEMLRWHTRVPIVDPARVTPAFIDSLLVGTKTVTVLVHTNHVDELSVDACAAIADLVDAGIVVRSQTVLLRGVNDRAEDLAKLFKALVQNRVTPYYLHHPDWAKGTSHFRLSVEEGATIVRELREDYSGIIQPQYIVDIPGGVAKVPVDLGYVDQRSGEATIKGARHKLW